MLKFYSNKKNKQEQHKMLSRRTCSKKRKNPTNTKKICATETHTIVL